MSTEQNKTQLHAIRHSWLEAMGIVGTLRLIVPTAFF